MSLAPSPSPSPDRLRSVADNCAELARKADGPLRVLLHMAAKDAGEAATARYMGDRALRHCLDKTEAIARAASLYMADPDTYTPERPVSAPVARPEAPLPPSRADLLNPAQIALVSGVKERRARDVIEENYRLGRPGFYRIRNRWFAEPGAFDRLGGKCRISADRLRSLSRHHDASDHEGRPQA